MVKARWSVVVVLMLTGSWAHAGVPDTPFVQEYHEPYSIDPGGPGNDVRAIEVTADGMVYAATKAGVRVLQEGRWQPVPGVTSGPTFDLFVDHDGLLWIGAWDGVYTVRDAKGAKTDGVDGPVSAVGAVPGGMMALGPRGAWRSRDGRWAPIEESWSRNVRDIVSCPDGTTWIATGLGLYRIDASGTRHYYRKDELLSGEDNGLALDPDGRLWIASWGGLDVYRNSTRVDYFTTEKGLPCFDVRSVTFAPDGTLWAGTALGVARYATRPEWVFQNNGSPWSLRHSRRWLLSDDVRDVAVAPNGDAWVATAEGVSAIKRRTMTLAEKAEYYHDILLKRHVREPWLVEKCYFPDPKDHSKWEPRDDDNDGQYTNMYMVMESLKYAVTKDAKAKERADKAFDAMEFLQTVTGTDGFFARTVVPSTWTKMADANETFTPEEIADRLRRDPRWKPVEQRWRPSADGKWLWKGDTSSDEMTGHFFGYYYYFKLAADESRKERVRALVSKIMDHILANGYTLTDIDGTPTRWGVWSPEKLQGDPDWRVEGKINSFELLSYLKTAYYITGNQKYQDEYLTLIERYGYHETTRRPKADGRSEWNHIDDELLSLAAPGLLHNETDPLLLSIYREGLEWSYRMVENDQNALFNFLFGAVGGKDFHIEETVAFLRDQPLDLVQWWIDNSKREDIQFVRRPMADPLQTSRMLPPSERGVMRWDKNPWTVVSGDFGDPEGHLESCGVFWLLPYWMGRYYGWIEK